MAQRSAPLKFGWLRRHCGFAAALLLLGLPAGAGAARIVFAGGGWAAIDFGGRCEARTKGLWPKSGTEPFAGFAFDPASERHGQFYVHLSRPARAGATVIATLGTEPFLLSGQGEWAWSRDPAQQQAILDAARYGSGLRIESRDSGGSRIVDRYDLAGAATAIDAAAAACAGKNR
jgi:hypothetical protein